MREFLLENCLFTLEQCQLLEGNLQLYVNIAGVAIIFYVLCEHVFQLIALLLSKPILRIIKAVKASRNGKVND